MKNLYLLQTERASKLFENERLCLSDYAVARKNYVNYHLYITSKELSSSEEWFLKEKNDLLHELKPEIAKKCRQKIILTTDPLMEGVQQIDDEFLKWFVKNPTCEFIQVVTGLNTEGKNGLDRARFIYKTIIPKQQTLEEVAEEYSKGWGKNNDQKSFIAGAKWQQERDYELIDRYVDDVMGGCNLRFKEWINR